MLTKLVLVADTNVFVSALLLPSSVAAKALNNALALHPFHEVAIVTPADFIAHVRQPSSDA